MRSITFIIYRNSISTYSKIFTMTADFKIYLHIPSLDLIEAFLKFVVKIMNKFNMLNFKY